MRPKVCIPLTIQMTQNLAVFASGSGTNAEQIIRYFANGSVARVVLVVTNNPQAQVILRAAALNVSCVAYERNAWSSSSCNVLELLKNHEIDYIILAGFLAHVPNNVLHTYPNKVINIHPSLLPKFGGKGMYGLRVHQAVVEAGEAESGITIHYVNEHYDEGEIIAQYSCALDENDSPEDVALKVRELEHFYYPRVIEQVIVSE